MYRLGEDPDELFEPIEDLDEAFDGVILAFRVSFLNNTTPGLCPIL